MAVLKPGASIPLLNPYFDLHQLLSSQSLRMEVLKSMRRKLVAAYAWAIPSHLALEALSRYSPLIELGAGTGYWAFCVRQIGTDILAFDRNADAPPQWSRVEKGDESVLTEPSSPLHQRALFLCWPPLDEPLAESALDLYRGNTVIETGEPQGGRTGSRHFHQRLERDWALVECISLPHWPGYRDELRVWMRKS